MISSPCTTGGKIGRDRLPSSRELRSSSPVRLLSIVPQASCYASYRPECRNLAVFQQRRGDSIIWFRCASSE